MFKVTKLDHVGLVVKNLDDVKKFFTETLGLEIISEEIIENPKMRIVCLPCGESEINLMEPVLPPEPVPNAPRKGTPNHVALRVDDIQAAIDGVMEKGGKMIHQTPLTGKEKSDIAFINPETSCQILTHFSGAPRLDEN